ncbi:E3 ubiquitin-protein ligase RSL1-like [Bidens hawaiensis]|uniref:E3 ubiquitin-protein ligase RSL1-like n=1 Tax=Bidens hawaiensis TaxID=980011 RepID=UPI00404AC3D6
MDLIGDDENLPISDELYAEELQLQEALFFSKASITPSTSSPNQNTSSSSSLKQPLISSSEASKSPAYSFCAICMDTKPASEIFENTNICSHLYCLDCIRGHVAAKIQENRAMVKCPDPNCKGVIEPEACRFTVPNEVLERWEKFLCESMIAESDKFYCPFLDCSALLVNDDGVAVTPSECPNCHRLFCAQCKVAWHCEMNCVEFQSLKKGKGSEKLLTDLANNQKWMKCSKCNFYVERVDGCNHISCRCGHQFCYKCGKPSDHARVGQCCGVIRHEVKQVLPSLDLQLVLAHLKLTSCSVFAINLYGFKIKFLRSTSLNFWIMYLSSSLSFGMTVSIANGALSA